MRFYEAGRAERRLRGRHPEGARAAARGARVPVPGRARPRRRRRGRRLPPDRLGARRAPVVLPLERDSRRRAAGGRRGGKLADLDELERQVRRLLADPRSTALVDNFASRWLQLRRIRGVAPDADIFYDFDENLRADMERETMLFLASQIREDRGLLELLTADYTFVNERARPALRHPRRLRRALPARRRRPGATGRPARTRQPADADRLPEPHVTRAARQVGARQRARDAAAGTARRRAGPRGEPRGPARSSRYATGWSSTAPTRPARRATASWIRPASSSRTTTPSGAGALPTRPGHPSTRRGRSPTGPRWRPRPRSARRSSPTT